MPEPHRFSIHEDPAFLSDHTPTTDPVRIPQINLPYPRFRQVGQKTCSCLKVRAVST